MGTVAKSLAEHWHWKEMQHRAFKEFTDTTTCCTVTTKFFSEIAHLDGKESDEDLNECFSRYGLNREALGGYEAKLSQFFHPANATSIWKSIAFVLLSVLTFGIYYAVSATLLWRSFHRCEDALHKTLTSASRAMEADSDLANALLLSRILLLAEKLFKCYPLPSKSADMDAVNAAYDEWLNKDLRFFLVSNSVSLLDDDTKTDGGEQSPPNDADGAMRKFLSLYDTSHLEDFKPAYAFCDEVKQNFSVHAQDFGTLCKLIRQRGALQKLKDTKKTALSDAKKLLKSQTMACDELNLGSSKFLLGDVKILLGKISKGEGVGPDEANLKKKLDALKNAILEKFQFWNSDGTKGGEIEFLKFFIKKSSNTIPITADEFLVHCLDGILSKIGGEFATCAFHGSKPGTPLCCIMSYLEEILKSLYVDSHYKLAATFTGCYLDSVKKLSSSFKDLSRTIYEECKKHYGKFQDFFTQRKQELEATPEHRERVATIGKSAEDGIRKTFLPIALGFAPADRDGDRQAK
jgi:hypothetical protein